MSVYTTVDPASLARWLEGYAVGNAGSLRPIAEGVENTNYFLDAGGKRYVLTLFERLDLAALPFYLGLMRRLAEAGVGSPKPVVARDGSLFSMLCGKPAALVSRLAGGPVERPTALHCRAIGDWLARMHAALADFAPRLPNPRGAEWRQATAVAVQPFLSAADRSLLCAAQAVRLPDGLPRGIVHADLFRDNALWVADAAMPALSGVIDFYFAGEDALLFDLAVTANDWCQCDAVATDDAERVAALLDGYAAIRPLTGVERAAWPAMRSVSALRFWLSRLADLHLPRPGALVKVKDPAEYRAILVATLAAGAA